MITARFPRSSERSSTIKGEQFGGYSSLKRKRTSVRKKYLHKMGEHMLTNELKVRTNNYQGIYKGKMLPEKVEILNKTKAERPTRPRESKS